MAPIPPQKILIVDDESDVHYSFKRLLAKDPLIVLTASNGEEGLRIIKKEKPDVVVMDIRMGKESGLSTLREIHEYDPKQIVIMMTAYGTSQTAIEAMKQGAYDYVLKPFDIQQLKDLLKKALDAARDMRDLVELSAPVDNIDPRTSVLIGKSKAMQGVYKQVGQVAPTEATVLITGESGTGKELIARAIYSNSSRNNQTYIAINCAAIPENLLESELFGHEKGSFTGAAMQRIGKFEQCHDGTLFLDEIGDMPINLQTKILRVLQDGEIFRVGGDNPIRTDVRIIAATNKDLWQAVQRKEFREDLYYRLNVFSISLPPLRDRSEDVPDLVGYFIKKWRARQSTGPVKASEEAMRVLQNHRWPGNVRELENTIQRAMVLASTDAITIADLPEGILSPQATNSVSTNQNAPTASAPSQTSSSTSSGGDLLPVKSSSPTSVQEAIRTIFEHAHSQKNTQLLPTIEKELIIYALEQTMGNQVRAAKMLGITRATLRKRVEKFGIMKRMKIDLASS